MYSLNTVILNYTRLAILYCECYFIYMQRYNSMFLHGCIASYSSPIRYIYILYNIDLMSII